MLNRGVHRRRRTLLQEAMDSITSCFRFVFGFGSSPSSQLGSTRTTLPARAPHADSRRLSVDQDVSRLTTGRRQRTGTSPSTKGYLNAHTDSRGDSYPATISSASILGKGISNQKGRILRSRRFDRIYDMPRDAAVLGTGLSGSVRVAKRKSDGQRVAVKVLSTRGLPADKIDEIVTEVKIYLRLDHPNICRLLEVYDESAVNGNVFLVMELCTGRELYDRLAMRKRFSERDASDVVRQMVLAVNYCHNQNICHRDLKLENFVYADMSEKSRLKLIDFGLSRIFSRGVPMTAITGTVYYVAPEVMTGKYDYSCDMWSIGVMTYMLLAGVPPFDGDTDKEILRKVSKGTYSFSGPSWDFISSPARDFISKLLQKDPADRLSAGRAINHPWLLRYGNEDGTWTVSGTLDPSLTCPAVVKSMRDFAQSNVLKRAAIGLMAYSTTYNTDLEAIAKEFQALDIRGTGTVSAQDLMAVLRHHLNVDQSEARFIFQRIDAGQGGEIHYSEFLAAAMSARMMTHEKQIREMFAKMDTDGTGKITADNLREVLGESYDGTPVEEIIAECDKNGDGFLDWHEFEAVLLDRVAHNDQTVKVAGPSGEDSSSVDEGYDPLWEKITGQKSSSPDTSRKSTGETRNGSEGADHVRMEKKNTRRSRFNWEQLAQLGRKLVPDRSANEASAKRGMYPVS
ncbi:calcium-dependent protein kinase, putative [Perkinsus marinus ATCC 50983]|uniref:Calcium-dependent protein kinase, putative n=1 Tax=Perkinsus marinus (strain ATCC 50983 / TXsc) TaxID=423536 RepID=C5KVW6_PERM5|nr:calcium-dependent protein kinase, putative [Perkinsus marinus ATCC 50983]EER11357.1 calcium-dependent protein kinase, putative [Perkinsus marinus ATCC 50983]|eukprot:XP_002779562.1 calcium-dependent protein kinase, putative [Perkinsus marinus ATCC 50983]